MHAGIQEVQFFPSNPTDKRTALTYIDRDGKMHKASKGAPEQVNLPSYICLLIPCLVVLYLKSRVHLLSYQILHLSHNKPKIERKVHVVIDKFAKRTMISCCCILGK